MKTCRTCKHWASVPDNYYRGFDHSCESPKFNEGGSRTGETDCMSYPYEEGGGFFPGPDFGCIHHEDAESESGIGPDCKICGFNKWKILPGSPFVECENCGHTESP